jgi:hypothetical protein
MQGVNNARPSQIRVVSGNTIPQHLTPPFRGEVRAAALTVDCLPGQVLDIVFRTGHQ